MMALQLALVPAPVVQVDLDSLHLNLDSKVGLQHRQQVLRLHHSVVWHQGRLVVLVVVAVAQAEELGLQLAGVERPQMKKQELEAK
jgi:hypothetical protein